MIAAQTTIADWVHLIRSAYLDIPGLHLTLTESSRIGDGVRR
jgi:hypothetical protein